MVNDPTLQELVNKYDHVFNFNFLVYGDLKDEEVGLLTKGLIVMIRSQRFAKRQTQRASDDAR